MNIKKQDIKSYMSFAHSASLRSKAERLKVGAVIVNSDGVMAFGYNGTPTGWDNCCEENNVTKPEVIHGEINAIFKFVQSGISTKDCVLFLTHSPCLDCAKVIYLSGVSHIFFADNYRSEAGITFLDKMGIRCEQYK